MRRTAQLLALASGLLLTTQVTAQPLRGGPKGPRGGGNVQSLQIEASGANRRNDLEGAIWEYKVVDTREKDRSKRTVMTGRLRMKQSSIYSIGAVEVADRYKDKEDAGSATKSGGEGGPLIDRLRAGRSGDGPLPRGDIQARMGNAGLGQSGKLTSGTERVGDLSRDGDEYLLRFDEDDAYVLSGRAMMKYDTKDRGGVWQGNYDEYENGKKKRRWRFELRKVEE